MRLSPGKRKPWSGGAGSLRRGSSLIPASSLLCFVQLLSLSPSTLHLEPEGGQGHKGPRTSCLGSEFLRTLR